MGDYTAPLVNQWGVQTAPGADDAGGVWKYPSAGSLLTTDGGSWSSTSVLLNSDLSDALTWSVSNGVTAGLSSYLYVSGFGLSIPSSATILGVEAYIRTGGTYSTNVLEESVRLALSASAATMSSDNKASGTTRAVETEYVKGSPSDLWGETTATLTPAVLNASAFGLVYRANRNSTAASTMLLRALALRVTYSVVEDGAVRVTQEYAEVIVRKTEPIRVTQVYAEVLTKTADPIRVTQVYAEVIRSIADAAPTVRPRRLIFFQGG